MGLPDVLLMFAKAKWECNIYTIEMTLTSSAIRLSPHHRHHPLNPVISQWRGMLDSLARPEALLLGSLCVTLNHKSIEIKECVLSGRRDFSACDRGSGAPLAQTS